MRNIFLGAAALLAAGRADAAVINLINVGGVTAGSPSAVGFQTAARFWAQHLTNNVTINLNVGYSTLPSGVLGQTSSTTGSYGVGTVVQRLSSVGTSQIDGYTRNALAGAAGGGAVKVITAGYRNASTKTGLDAAKRVYDADGSTNNRYLGLSSANAKALGLSTSTTSVDATIKFSSSFSFDFNPNDGIATNAIDFVGVAVHEIGHALGFMSGVDSYDYYAAAKGPGAASYTANSNNAVWASPLDLFRYSANAAGLGGTGAKMSWAPGDAAYFSINGGAAYQNAYFSTGRFNGDGWQASHWKRGGTTLLGSMDPATGYGQQDVVKSLDLAAMDAIGWNIDFDPMANPTWTWSTRQMTLASGTGLSSGVYAGGGGFGVNMLNVPEPSSWAMMVAGFGMLGIAVRRRRPVMA